MQAAGSLAAFSAASRASAPAVDASTQIDGLPRAKQQLGDPPFVPEHGQVAGRGPAIFETELAARENKNAIDRVGTEIAALPFNGSIPGPLIISLEGDCVELTWRNPHGNRFMHSSDSRASTGALGGGGLTKPNLGEQVVLRWKAINPGTLICDCAPGGSMIHCHVVSGMDGAVTVLPRGGCKGRDGSPIRSDKAPHRQAGFLRSSQCRRRLHDIGRADGMAGVLQVMRQLMPSHGVLSGKVGALTGDDAMKAEVGETV